VRDGETSPPSSAAMLALMARRRRPQPAGTNHTGRQWLLSGATKGALTALPTNWGDLICQGLTSRLRTLANICYTCSSLRHCCLCIDGGT